MLLLDVDTVDSLDSVLATVPVVVYDSALFENDIELPAPLIHSVLREGELTFEIDNLFSYL